MSAGTEQWEQAYRKMQERRTPEATQQIADARAEPTSAEIEAQMADAQWPRTRAGQLDTIIEAATAAGIDPTPPDTITLSGAKLEAYRKLEAAAGAAHAAQQSMATTGAALREAIQGLCAAMTSGEGK